MLYNEKSFVSRLALGSTMYYIWLQRNASIHQGRLPFEEAMVKVIRWEVKNRVECNSYCNCSKQENTVFGGISCSVLQNSSSQWSLSPLTNGFGNFMLQCLWCSVGCFYIGAVLFGCVLNYKHYNMKFPNPLVKGDKDHWLLLFWSTEHEIPPKTVFSCFEQLQ